MKRKQGFLLIGFMLFSIFSALSTVAAKSMVITYTDLNYHYAMAFIGKVNDFSTKPASKDLTETDLFSKIVIELSIESIYGGFEWLPLNPLITDNNNHVFQDYKVVVEPPAGERSITVKYIVTPTYRDSKWFSFYEEGVSQDGKKAYRVFLRNIPVVGN